MTSIQVAVRVRPFNSREQKYQSSLIVTMKGRTLTELTEFKNGKIVEGAPPRKFYFDYCFWTHSNDTSDLAFPIIDPDTRAVPAAVLNHTGPIYSNQEFVYNQLGLPILDNAVIGFNACLFAYGQTGSGKTYTMMGVASDPGIIPQMCHDLFDRAHKLEKEGVEISVMCSYLEIYNENVRDLLNPANMNTSLRVRQHPKLGVYVEDLTKLTVTSEEEIIHLLEDGSKVRHVAATNMNATSSRSHAILTLTLSVKRGDIEVGGHLNLVDLAGSERLSATGAEGVTLTEGANINKSLTTLGMCLSRLADAAEGKAKLHIPYRDSQLTWILNDSLGGNSKTAMIANISPASINFEETLSTLRFAMTVKKIKNHAVINEDPQQRIIRELRAEIEELKRKIAELESGMPIGDDNMTPEEREMAQLEALEQATKLLEEASGGEAEKKKRAEEARAEHERAMAAFQKQLVTVDNTMPRIVTLNEDLHAFPSVALLYYLREGVNRIGCGSDSKEVLIQLPSRLAGEEILKYHAEIECNALQKIVTIKPCSAFIQPESMTATDYQENSPVARHPGSRYIIPPSVSLRLKQQLSGASASEAATVFVNGLPIPVDESYELRHNDRIVIGSLAFRHTQPPAWFSEDTEEFSRRPVTTSHLMLLEQYERTEIERECLQGLEELVNVITEEHESDTAELVEVRHQIDDFIDAYRGHCADERAVLLYSASETEQLLCNNYPVTGQELFDRQAALLSKEQESANLDYAFTINERDQYVREQIQKIQSEDRDKELLRLKEETQNSEAEIEKLRSMLAEREAQQAREEAERAERRRKAQEEEEKLAREKELHREKLGEATAKTNNLRSIANDLQLYLDETRNATMWKPQGPLAKFPSDVEEYLQSHNGLTYAEVEGEDGKHLKLPPLMAWKYRNSNSSVFGALRAGWHRVYVLVRARFIYYFVKNDPKTVCNGSVYLYGCDIKTDPLIEGRQHTLRIIPCVPRSRTKDTKGKSENNNLLFAFDDAENLDMVVTFISGMHRPLCPPRVADYLKELEDKKKTESQS